ncbi:hypothetical protein EDD11_005968 [Mortierella claussenii]|nr:hypothetical protein EDD11_005968 [Mortierella claussenii]
MYKMKTSMGFSSVTCGVLIVSSIIRIFFWIGDPFDVALLYQSILMTVVQLFLLELCVRYYPWTIQLPAPATHPRPVSRNSSSTNANGNIHSSNNGSISINTGTGSTSLGPDHISNRASRYQSQGWYREHAIYWGTHFWNWPTIMPYYLFLAVFTLLLGLSLLAIGNTDFYVGLLGLAALGIEATVPLPQALQNHRTKSTKGFSPAILLMWVIGDSFKTYYYITTGAKYQFVGCGIIQLCIDCVIITQTVIYSKFWKNARHRRHEGGFMAGLSSLLPQSEDYVGGANVAGRSSSEALLASDDEVAHEEQQQQQQQQQHGSSQLQSQAQPQRRGY